MNLSTYTELLTHPENVGAEQTAALEAVSAEYPYFQSARALRLKGLYNENSFQYNYALKVTAAFTTDRSVLFDFITSPEFRSVGRERFRQHIADLHEIEVRSEVVVPESDAEKIERSIMGSIRGSESPVVDAADTTVTDMPENAIAPDAPGIPMQEQAREMNDPENLVAPVEVSPAETVGEDLTPPDIIAETEAVVAEASENAPTPVSAIEEKLDIGKPLKFAAGETHSFQEWLQLSALNPIDRSVAPPAELSPEEISEREKKLALIDRFIETNPKIKPAKGVVQDIDLSKAGDHSHLMTETLARVYLEQKKYSKAIQAYEILILKYPEKSSFFADRISEIKLLQQNNVSQ